MHKSSYSLPPPSWNGGLPESVQLCHKKVGPPVRRAADQGWFRPNVLQPWDGWCVPCNWELVIVLSRPFCNSTVSKGLWIKDAEGPANFPKDASYSSFDLPTSSYLTLLFETHITVEICATIKSVKYLFKYIRPLRRDAVDDSKGRRQGADQRGCHVSGRAVCLFDGGVLQDLLLQDARSQSCRRAPADPRRGRAAHRWRREHDRRTGRESLQNGGYLLFRALLQ